MKAASSLPDDVFKITERLNAVYTAETSRVEKPLRRAQRRAVGKTEW